MSYHQIDETCPNCEENLAIFLEIPLSPERVYSFVCPHCNKESTFRRPFSSPTEELPSDAIFAKVFKP